MWQKNGSSVQERKKTGHRKSSLKVYQMMVCVPSVHVHDDSSGDGWGDGDEGGEAVDDKWEDIELEILNKDACILYAG